MHNICIWYNMGSVVMHNIGIWYNMGYVVMHNIVLSAGVIIQ